VLAVVLRVTGLRYSNTGNMAFVTIQIDRYGPGKYLAQPAARVYTRLGHDELVMPAYDDVLSQFVVVIERPVSEVTGRTCQWTLSKSMNTALVILKHQTHRLEYDTIFARYDKKTHFSSLLHEKQTRAQQ